MDFDKTKLKQLRKLFRRRKRSVDWYFEAGELVSDLTPEPKPQPNRPKRYRMGIRRLAGVLLGENAEHNSRRRCESQLYRARLYYDSFDWSELSSLGDLPPSSADILLQVQSRKKRKRLLQDYRKHNWTLRELRRVVASAKRRRSRRGAGRDFKPIKFRDSASVIRDIASQAKHWLHHHEYWLRRDGELTKAIPKRLSGPQKEALRDACKKLAEVANAVETALDVLEPPPARKRARRAASTPQRR